MAERELVVLIAKDISLDILSGIKDIEDENLKLTMIARHVRRALTEMF